MSTSPEKVTNAVAGLRGRMAAALAARGLLVLAAAVGLAALAVILLDATLVLDETVRARVAWILAAVATAALVAGLVSLRRLRAVRVARELEHRHPELGTALTNAVQLARERGRTDVEELLRRNALALGRRRARKARVWPVVRASLAASAGAVAVTAGRAAGGTPSASGTRRRSRSCASAPSIPSTRA